MVSLFVVAFVIGAALILLFPPSPYKEAVKLASQGDSYLQQGIPQLAIKSYEQAENKWSVYKIDPRFQQKKRKAEGEVKKKVAVTVFFKDEAKDSEIQGLIQEIKAIQGVREVKFISKEEALKIYQEINKNEPLLTELITKDILPATIEVYLNDLPIKNKVVGVAENKSFVNEVIKSDLY